jgi:hypothetical protein
MAACRRRRRAAVYGLSTRNPSEEEEDVYRNRGRAGESVRRGEKFVRWRGDWVGSDWKRRKGSLGKVGESMDDAEE